MTPAGVIAIVAAVVVGSALQRISGMGLALVAAPTLSLLVEPVAGILVINVATVVSSTMVLVVVWRDVHWRRYLQIVSWAIVGSIPGALFVREVPSAWLDMVVGGTVLLGLAISLWLRRAPAMSGAGPAALAGVVGGFMNTTAGVAGPAITVYALASRWEQRGFAATLQPIFLTVGLFSLLSKVVLGAAPASGQVPWWLWPAIVAGLLCGVAGGGQLVSIIKPNQARGVAVALATIGAALALGRGLLAL